jgi:hypothetical protein
MLNEQDMPLESAADIPALDGSTVIWLLCHYPYTKETDERVDKAAHLYKRSKYQIWLYGSSSARYPQAVERLMKQKLIEQGVPPEAIICSGDLIHVDPSLDTVQEACNVVSEAKRRGIKTLICVSNRLQLLQVRTLLRQESIHFVWMPTRLRDWRWWYVAGRLVLVPLAFLGFGPRFVPLVFVRWARAKLARWPF